MKTNLLSLLLKSISVIIFFTGLSFIAVGQVTYYVDDDTGDDSRTPLEAQNPATPWLTVTHAINTVTDGDTIVVAPGTYSEQITVDKSITLRGATYNVNKNGYAVPANYAWDDNVETILDCPAGVQIYFLIDNVNNVIVEGFVIQALYRDSHVQNHLFYIKASSQTVDNVLIRNNVIGPNTNIVDQDGTKGRMNLDIDMIQQDYGLTNSLITGNKIFDSKGNGNNIFLFGSYEVFSYSISAPMYGTVIEDNEIYGSHRSGIEVAGGIEGLTIMNNKIYNNSGYITDPPDELKYGNGILILRGSSDLVSGSAAHGAKNCVIHSNEIYDNEKNGIYMGPIDSALQIIDNRIENNGWDGIRIDLEERYFINNSNWNPVYDQLFDIVSEYNNIMANDSAGVRVIGIPTNGFVLEGKYNYWDAEDGPAGVGPGSGNSVSDFVNFTPWVDDAIEDYGLINTNTQTGVGPAGGEALTTITSVPNDDNYLQGYQTGLFGDLPELDEDFVTNNTGCMLRFKILWGLVETGDVTADITIDYSNQTGITDPSDIVILQRDNALDATWELAPETSRDDVARTITLGGITEFKEYVLGLKGKIWTAGNGNNNWNDPLNWFSFGVPTQLDNVVIPFGPAFYPETNDGPLAVTKELFIEAGAYLMVPDNNGLTTFGDVTNFGQLIVDSKFNGNSGTFINEGALGGTGTYSFNRHITGLGAQGNPEGWHYLSSPVTGMSCHSMFDYFINDWDETQNTWYNYSPSDMECVPGPDNPLNIMKGYSVKRSMSYACGAVNPGTGSVIEFTGGMGEVNTGNYSIAVTGTDFSGGGVYDNWNLVGNPYSASIDYEVWHDVMGGIPPQVDDAVYYWDDAALTYRQWVNGVGYTQFIPPTQGFFMHTNTPGTWSLDVDNTVRTHSGANEFFKSSVKDLLVIKASGNEYEDLTYIRFMEKATPGFDGKYDAFKLLSEVEYVPQVYTLSGKERLSINSLPETESMELAFRAGIAGMYTLEATEQIDFETLLLEDLHTGNIVDLKSGSYSFNYSPEEDDARFIIHFGSSQTNGEEDRISVYSAGGQLYVNNGSGSTGHVTVYNLLGQGVHSAEVYEGLNTYGFNTKDAYYIIQITTDAVTKSVKFFIE